MKLKKLLSEAAAAFGGRSPQHGTMVSIATDLATVAKVNPHVSARMASLLGFATEVSDEQIYRWSESGGRELLKQALTQTAEIIEDSGTRVLYLNALGQGEPKLMAKLLRWNARDAETISVRLFSVAMANMIDKLPTELVG